MATEWSERRDGDVVIVDISGALTIGTQHLREHFTDLFERGDKKILVNLEGVPYMDSTSVGDLIVGHLQAAETGAVFKLVNIPPKIAELLRMHHLIQVFDHYDDEDAALASFGRG
jgi:anti-sigma B factor antagonist